MTYANVRFEGNLDLRELPAGEWQMLAPLACRWTEGTEPRGTVVPEGFVHDLASIPRVFRSLISVVGPWNKPAVLHDWLYVTRWRSRRDADALFLAALQAAGVGWLTRRTMWAAVRVGGWTYWRTR